MKIKNFMKETDKKLKKHSYNAHSIMEALQGNAKLIDVVKNPRLNPDVIYNDDLGMTCYKKDKGSPEEDIANLKKYDIIVNRKGSRPWVGYYEGKTPDEGGLKITVLTADGDDYYMDQTAFGDTYFLYNWDDYDVYSSKRDVYKAPKTSGEEFNECLNETYKHDGDIVYDEETGITYKLLEFESDSKEDILHELEKVQKGDLILMEISGVKKIRKLSSSINPDSYVYIDSGHWSDYQISCSFIVDGIMGGYISIYIRDEHYDVSKGEKLKDTGEDWDEQLNESPRIPTLRRHGVAYHQVNSANIFDEEALYDMLIPNKTLINVPNELSIMSNDYHQFTAGKYEVMGKIDSPKRVHLKKTTLSRAHWYNLNKIFSVIESGDATLWYPTEKADYTNSANIITDTGDDWIEESVNSDSKDYDEDFVINGKRYIIIPYSYIDNEDYLASCLKDNMAYIVNKSMDLYRYCSMTEIEGSGYRLNLNYKDVTNGKELYGHILLSSLLTLLKNQQYALYVEESIAKEVGLLSDENIPSGDEFNESLYETSNYEHSDEPGTGIIEYKGRKYYKVDAERHIHKQSDLMKYLVKGVTIFKGNPDGKELIYQGWEPQKVHGYKLNDKPYEINFKMDGNSEGEYAPFRFSFNGMYDMLVNVEHLFDVFIPEELAERYGIKDEWELTSGDEFNECKNLKGTDLETLKEGTIISGKKKVRILNKKGNFYNVISEGKKYKYSIDDLKYDYTHKKIKIFEGKERLLKQASIAGFPKGYITSDDLYYRVSQPDDLFEIKDVGAPNYVQLHYVEGEEGYPDFEVMSLSNLKRLYDMGKLKKINTKQDGSEFED